MDTADRGGGNYAHSGAAIIVGRLAQVGRCVKAHQGGAYVLRDRSYSVVYCFTLRIANASHLQARIHSRKKAMARFSGFRRAIHRYEQFQLSRDLAGQFTQEIAFVHVILKGFAAVDEDDGNLVSELAAELVVAVDIYLLPVETAMAMELVQALFDDLAEMAPLAAIENDLPGLRHGGSVTPQPWFEYNSVT